MSLCMVTDAFMGARAADGDEAAFAELARRYRPLIEHFSACPPAGVDVDDLRQAALLALHHTCRVHDPARGAFAALAKRNVRRGVNHARAHACTIKHRLLSDATRDGDDASEPLTWRLPAPAGADPARVVELRDELRERAQRARKLDRRRRYSDEQAARALALIADGHTIKQAAFAVGARPGTVRRWLKRSGQRLVVGRRRFTPAEISHAVALVRAGATLRQPAAAVGTTSPTVFKWTRQAA